MSCAAGLDRWERRIDNYVALPGELGAHCMDPLVLWAKRFEKNHLALCKRGKATEASEKAANAGRELLRLRADPKATASDISSAMTRMLYYGELSGGLAFDLD